MTLGNMQSLERNTRHIWVTLLRLRQGQGKLNRAGVSGGRQRNPGPLQFTLTCRCDNDVTEQAVVSQIPSPARNLV